MAKQQKEEKRVNIFLIPGEYDPAKQEPKHPRLIINESDLKLFLKQKTGLQYIPKRWMEHDNFRYDFPHLSSRGNILGMIVPSGELASIVSLRHEIVLLGSLPGECFKCRRYPELTEADKKLHEAWENLHAAYAELMNQLETAKKKEKCSQ